MITVNLADGRQLNFPDGTDTAIIQAKVKELLQVDSGFELPTRQQKDETLQNLLAQQLAGGGELTREQRRTGQPSQLQQQVTEARQASARPTREEAADITRQQGFEELNAGLSRNQSDLVALGAGFTDLARGVSNLTGVGNIEQESDVGKQALADLADKRPISQAVNRFAGQTLPFSPAGALSAGIGGFGLRSLVQGILGSSEAAAVAEGTGGDAKFAAGLGIAGALAAPLFKVGQILNTKLASGVAVVDSKIATIQKILQNESDDVRGLGFKLIEGESKIQKVPAVFKAAKKAEIQGVSRPQIALLAATNKATAKKTKSMLDIASKSLNSVTFKNKNRASDVLGQSFSNRLSVLGRAQRKAGRDIDRAAKAFDLDQKGFKRIAPEGFEIPIINPSKFEAGFVADLRKIGVKVNRDNLDFAGSIIEGEVSTQRVLNIVAKRFREIDRTNPKSLHEFKRFIDSKITFGKSSEGGLAAQADNVVKALRFNINQELKGISKSYDKANTDYSDIITALEPFKKLTGKKIDALSEPGKASSIGTLLRRELSNAPSRNPVFEARNEIDKLANRFGGNFQDSLDQQLSIVQILEELNLSTAKTSIKEQVAAPIVTNVNQAGLEVAKKGLELLKPKQSPRLTIKSLRDLLEASSK